MAFNIRAEIEESRGTVGSFLSVPARFVAVVVDDQRFEYLVRPNVLIEQVAKTMASEPDGRD